MLWMAFSGGSCLTIKNKLEFCQKSSKCKNIYILFPQGPRILNDPKQLRLGTRKLSRRKALSNVFHLCLNAESDSTCSEKPWNNSAVELHQEGKSSGSADATYPSNQTTASSDKLNVIWRWRVFLGIFISYMSYTVCRSTFTFVAPLLLQSGALQLEHVGLVTSSFPLFYGISKLLGGLVVDNFSPRRILGSGLALAGLTNVGLGLSDGYRWYASWWAANGMAQGCGAGACARILTAWFRSSERGFWWALWSCSANVGGVLAPLVSGSLARKTTWRIGMIAPGMFSLIIGFIFSWLIRDTPKEAGVSLKTEFSSKRTEGTASRTSLNSSFGYMETFIKGVLKNRTLWLLALSYFFVYFVKTSIRSFFHIYLMQQKGCHATDAAYRVSGMDIGGLAGTFISGILSDRLEGRRVPVVILFLTGLVFTLLLVSLLSTMAVNHVWLDFLSVVLFGFFLSGPTCLIGLIGAEQSDRRTVATATGLLGYISYLGAAVAGLPVTLAIRRFGWVSYFSTMIISSFLSVAFLLPLSKTSPKNTRACDGDRKEDESFYEVDGSVS
ncbi:hypothetical protein GAYE_SCF02G2200 [Galdieria yellowstonensis]|uniref:Major facilitator superfamily (MFS) profile domain-containing protein n=1 Tax=Galdieria yellowstonensis TaxID=3028027 RepID=A0AAV9IAH4_9RHOD|nr:hypothetical protein GAYE_SCF02G2200 [Galdieria yellowstonensis]